jgi:hypothetical protein
MTPHELIDRLGGEIVANKGRVVVDGKVVIVARFIGTELVYTDEGRDVATQENKTIDVKAVAKAVSKKATTKTRKTKA